MFWFCLEVLHCENVDYINKCDFKSLWSLQKWLVASGKYLLTPSYPWHVETESWNFPRKWMIYIAYSDTFSGSHKFLDQFKMI